MKASRTPSRDGAGITLAKRSGPGKHFRIGTLAWSGEHKELAYLTAAEFTRSIDLAESSISAQCDLILCAGRRVYCNRSPRELRAGGILERTKGAPVLYEFWGDDGGEWRAMHLVRGRPVTTILRRKQIVRCSDDNTARLARLAKVVASNAGVLRFEGVDVKALLLICAESYAMRVRNRRSAIRGAPSSGKLQEALQGVLGPSWVLLAPWHAPTWPRIGRTGAGNVWPVRGKPPFFGRLVADRLGFDDGTSPPVAVVHANTFLAGQPGSPHPTETVSTLAFSTFAPNPVQPLEPVATGGPPGASVPIVAWRYAEFELPYASGSARKDHPITAEQLWQEALKITLPGHDQPADVHDPDDPQLDLDPLPDMKSDARS